MLSKSSISSAYGLAQLATRKGLSLSVKEGSPLADLLEACDALDSGIVSDDAEAMASSAFASPEDELAAATSVATEDGQCNHTDELERLTDLAARAVSFTMDVARNQVTPAVKKVVEITEASIDSARASRMEPLVIEPRYAASLYDSADLGDILGKYENAPHRDIAPLRVTGTWDDAAGVGPLMTGNAAIDADIVRHFEGREAYAKDLWERYFASIPGKYRNADHRQDLQQYDDALVVFLGANALHAGDVPDGLQASLPEYRAYLGDLKEQAASRLGYMLKRDRNAVKAKQLVLDAPEQSRPGQPIKGTIVVHGPVYNEWLKAGGSPEALYGAVYQGDALNYHSVLANAEQNVAAWERYTNTLKVTAAFEQRTATIQGLKQGILAVANGLRDAGVISFMAEELMHSVNGRLAKLANAELENLFEITQTLVCDLFFPHTDAKDFLCAMNAAANANPGMDIREIALLVSIDYVTGWVASGIVVDGGE